MKKIIKILAATIALIMGVWLLIIRLQTVGSKIRTLYGLIDISLDLIFAIIVIFLALNYLYDLKNNAD
ncbi:hypothetical protein RD055328_12360 [Companilactobacillus sp. RD055328]|uniref:hypothetical protein n=1 Tax=Companilactobacillus sp. RD055328 TaxID=2916634 RepID=UPI001FC7EBF1|nr:hypothetical protein [Companilactobacillus sp. RD055328]GKQ43313.1 hypothetical protein RD055328_12360 [Companilactobacillus sp. RD055328]